MTTQTTIGHGSLFAIYDDDISPPGYVTVAQVTTVTPFAIARDAVETTHTESPNRAREFIPGLVDYGEATIELNFIPGSAADRRIRALFGSKALARCQVSSPTSPPQLVQLNAVVTAYSPSMPLDDKLTAQATFKISGKPTWVGE